MSSDKWIETGKNMNKKIAFALLFTPCSSRFAWALRRSSGKFHRIGYLTALDPATESTRAEAIRLALRELGYVEGQNVAFEYRYAERKAGSAP